jgi:hypothetical protein
MNSKLLWHYTDANGLHGILRDDYLRLSDVAFLNDRTERTHALAVARATLRTVAKTSRQKTLISGIRDYLTPDVWYTRLYICSLSETPATISQWQRYGADGYGYCLGLDASLLARRYEDARVVLKRILYQRKEQAALVSDRLKSCLTAFRTGEFYQDLGIRGDVPFDEATAHLAVRLAHTLVELKNPRFKDEREWRLICETERGDGFDWESPSFVVRGSYVKPYVVPPLRLEVGVGPTTSRLPIVTIICGPRLDRELAASSVRRLLNENCRADTRVLHSPLSSSWR